MRHRFSQFLFGLAALLLLAGCGSNLGVSTNFKVHMTEFIFEPAKFVVPAGEEITIEFTNSGGIRHDFVIMKTGVQVSAPFGSDDQANVYWEHAVDPGHTETVTFTAPADPGEYQVICAIPGHYEAGMTATLTVVEP